MKFLIFFLITFTSKAHGYSPWPDAIFHGKSSYEVFWFDIYKANLWTEGQSTDQLFSGKVAIKLEYKRDFEGRDIASKSAEEMLLTGTSKIKLRSWQPILDDAFIDVKAGDSIMAYYDPLTDLKLVFNDTKIIKQINDKQFSQAFLQIWLSPQSSDQGVWQLLKGQKK